MRLIDADNVLTVTRELGEAWAEFLDNYKAQYRKRPNFGEGIAFVHRAIKNAPTVDAVPVVHGHWGELTCDGYDGLHPQYAKPCSVCGKNSREYNRSFCSWCGSKMDGGAEDD